MKAKLFESEKEKHILIGVITILVLTLSISFSPSIKAFINENMKMGSQAEQEPAGANIEMSAKEYYDMFQCSCCGKSIDTNCCGMAKQRKAYVDTLLLDGVEGNELVYKMVKKFGFDVLMDQSKEQEIRDYILSQASDNPPTIEIAPSSYDFGTISQADGNVSTAFTIRNTGKSDLVIENIDTSCMCTTASLVYEGVESPRFTMSMHGNNPKDFELSIPPGDTAMLKVFYDPNAHGAQKKPSVSITREVTIISNDPVDFQEKVRIQLTQTQ